MFTSMWDIPPLEPDESTEPSVKSRRSVQFRQMKDVELALRGFALLDPKNIGSGLRSILNNAMERHSKFTKSQLGQLKTQFLGALELAHRTGGNRVFRLPDSRSPRGRPSASLFGGTMVALKR